MVELFKAGGFPMFFVVGFGLATIVQAALFARGRDARRLGQVRAWERATVFAILSGIAADFGAVAAHVPAHPEWTANGRYADVVLTGFGESMSPAILGFTLLSVAWLVAAVGERRVRLLGAAQGS